MLRVLTFTDLYPNPVQPRHGIFVEHRLRNLVATGAVTATVVAPVPKLAAFLPAFGRARAPANLPTADLRHGIRVHYPRFPFLPRLTNWVNPISVALTSLPVIQRLRRDEGDFHLIDAHFFYPVGIAAVLLGIWLNKPVVITARGSDINLHTRFRMQRAWIRWAANRAAALVTVSTALRMALADIGVPLSRITVVQNGVDLEAFKVRDRAPLRARLGWSRPTLLAVGNLVPEKGHDLIIEALPLLTDVTLVIVGSGPEEQWLRRLARNYGVESRVTWVPYLSQNELAEYYCAADATVLASSREGMANVLLESLACGTRVIASDVGGNAEVVCDDRAGVLLHERSAAAIVEAYRKVRASDLDASMTRLFAERFGWSAPIATLRTLLESVARAY